jgi:hypothetical protein
VTTVLAALAGRGVGEIGGGAAGTGFATGALPTGARALAGAGADFGAALAGAFAGVLAITLGAGFTATLRAGVLLTAFLGVFALLDFATMSCYLVSRSADGALSARGRPRVP